MPINSSVSIVSSVGSGGRNGREDTRVIQQRLNDLMPGTRVALVVDGLVGRKTIRMIRDFQQNACGFNWPDGRVDPGAQTISMLNTPSAAQAWATRSSVPADDNRPTVPGSGGGGLSPSERDLHEYLYNAVAVAAGSVKWTQEMLDRLLSGFGAAAKTFIASLGTESAITVAAEGFAVFRRAGISAVKTASSIGRMIIKKSAATGAQIIRRVGHMSGRVVDALLRVGGALGAGEVWDAAVDVATDLGRGAYDVASRALFGLKGKVNAVWDTIMDTADTLIEAVAGTVTQVGRKTLNFVRNVGRRVVSSVSEISRIINATMRGLAAGIIAATNVDDIIGRVSSGAIGAVEDFIDYAGDWASDYLS